MVALAIVPVLASGHLPKWALAPGPSLVLELQIHGWLGLIADLPALSCDPPAVQVPAVGFQLPSPDCGRDVLCPPGVGAVGIGAASSSIAVPHGSLALAVLV